MQPEERFCSSCGKPVSSAAGAYYPPPPPKRLTRDMSDKKLGGICSGFARYFGTDTTVMRLIWILLTLFTGVPIIVYILCWFIMPADYSRMAGYGPARGAPVNT
jgi:phage shock protein PspC (stress-responsive transcriptional regulator)